MSGSALTPISGTVHTGSVLTPAAAITELRLLLSAGLEEAFGNKAVTLRDALTSLMAIPSVALDTKDSLQAFLARLESNCSALRIHKPKVDQYRTLRQNMDSYTDNANNLLGRLNRLETEYNTLVATAADLQAQLNSNLDRQDAIVAEQGELQTQTQALASEHEANISSLTVAQGQYDFSLPVWNAALMSWERLLEVLGREPLLSTDPAGTETTTDNPTLPPS